MEKHYEVLERTIELLETIGEGFEHVEKQFSELRYEEGFNLLKDAMEAIESIENALASTEGLPENSIKTMGQNLVEGINGVVNSYEESKEAEIEEQISGIVLRDFKEWKKEIENIIKPYLLS